MLPKRTLRCRVVVTNAVYKDFAGAKPTWCDLEGKGGWKNTTMSGIGPQPEPEFAAFIGIDWADQKHIRCLQTAGSGKRETGELEHTPEAVES